MKDGSSESDYILSTGFLDDNEKGGGSTILKALEKEGAVDVAVVCSRWFGGQACTLTRVCLPF